MTLGLAEATLRVVDFSYHLYPERFEFGYPDKTILEDYFKQHDDYLWVSQRTAKNTAQAWAEKPYLIYSGCSCTEWGGFDEDIARRVEADTELSTLTYANLACSGWSSYQGLQQMKLEISKLKPKVVTIFFGWNDHWMGFGIDDKTAVSLSNSSMLKLQELRVVQLVTKAIVKLDNDQGKTVGANSRPDRVALDDFRSNISGMVRIAQENDITPVLITAPSSHVTGEEPPYLQERFLADLSRLVPLHRSYAEAVREIAAEQNVVLCDLASELDALPREELLTYFREDGIHFTAEGGVKVGEVLFKTLKEHELLPKAGEESQ